MKNRLLAYYGAVWAQWRGFYRRRGAWATVKQFWAVSRRAERMDDPPGTWKWALCFCLLFALGCVLLQAQMIAPPLQSGPPPGSGVVAAYPYGRIFMATYQATSANGTARVTLNQPFLLKFVDLSTGRVALVNADGSFSCIPGHALRFAVYAKTPWLALPTLSVSF